MGPSGEGQPVPLAGGGGGGVRRRRA